MQELTVTFFHNMLRRNREKAMPLIIVIVLLTILKYFEIGPFGGMSWWWIVGLVAAAFIWFEFIERMLGLDKRKAHEQMEKARQDRINKTFNKK
jgi:small Trp-rich protein